MQLLGFSASQVHPLATLDQAHDFLAGNAAARFVWADFSTDEVALAPAAWRDSLLGLTGAPILDLHLQDATNPAHPSYFDTTNAYDMVIFRKLTFETSQQVAAAAAAAVAATAAEGQAQEQVQDGAPAPAPSTPAQTPSAPAPQKQRRYPPGFLPALARLDTQPVTFFVFDAVLVTISPGPSRTIDQVRQRLIETCTLPRQQVTAPGNGNGHTAVVHGVRPPTRPEDLMLRLLNAMVDRYLELRAPLTRQLDRWQRALLSTRRSFSSWEGLLDARIELRRLENLSEEQRDALQEFRDSLLENRYSTEALPVTAAGRDEVLLVRINDLMEHIQRVLAHARRLEDSIESAVQIHFSAVAHRTNLTMRTLTLITAIFMPLTLITGVFGMNFERMPWLREPDGFWWSIGLMGLVVAVLAAVWGLSRRLRR